MRRWLLAAVVGLLVVASLGIAAALGAFASSSKSAAPARSESASSGDSAHLQRLKVHGHWTIEVRSRAGKVVARRDFENELTSAGQVDLAYTLSHQGVIGPWGIRLGSLTTSPCNQGGNPDDACYLTEPGATSAGNWQQFYPDAVTTLSVTPQLSSAPFGLKLEGTINAAKAGSIDQVQSMYCFALGRPDGADCNNSGDFTQASVTPVAVEAGQQILARVTISFS